MKKYSLSGKFFSDNGPIAAGLDAYEVRPQQIRMAEAVEKAICGSGTLIVEAGTGIGKSLAYLVPFADWAVSENKRVVVSTYTKALQTQLFVKDLPFIQRSLGIPLRYAICMGSENYVCLRKALRHSQAEFFASKKAHKQVERIMSWLSSTETGLKTDLDVEPDAAVWDLFSREAGMCLGRKCRRAAECFYLKARQEQGRAHVLITNHSLLFTDMMSEAKLLPEFHGLVLDEAHTLEDVATSHFGQSVSSSSLARLLEGVHSAVSPKTGPIAEDEGLREKAREVRERAKALHAAGDALFAKAAEFFGKEERMAELEGSSFDAEDISAEAAALALALDTLARALADTEERELVHSLVSRCDDLAGALDFILYQPKESDYVYWADVRPLREGIAVGFHAAPIDISAVLREHLFEAVSPIVLTSATLASSSGAGKPDFSFIKRRLGVGPCDELVLDSPFDYAKNVLLCTPKGVPDPGTAPADYKKKVKDGIVELYDIMGGRMFALFTSYDMLNSVAAMVSSERPDIGILKQGDLPRYVLLDVFKKSGKSVLMGTATFWQGVDVPGNALECVVITRLPFSVPTDPVNAARIKALERKGKSAFLEYQLPQALIMFKQGFGRLIRTASDRGVVVVMDPRIRTRYYGRKFIEALPKCRRTDSIKDVSEFFEDAPGELRVEYEEE